MGTKCGVCFQFYRVPVYMYGLQFTVQVRTIHVHTYMCVVHVPVSKDCIPPVLSSRITITVPVRVQLYQVITS